MLFFKRSWNVGDQPTVHDKKHAKFMFIQYTYYIKHKLCFFF